MAIRSRLPLCAVLVLVLLNVWSGIEVVEGSHAEYRELMSVPATVVDNVYRTAYHFQPPRNWMNDPNGPMYYNGIYHLFYQWNPYGAVWGNIVWGHSVSTDLINWKSLEPAIYPSKPFDKYGCWSGSATILPGNKPAILYTGIVDDKQSQVQNIAFPKNLSDPYLREWVKPDSYNPVIRWSSGINANKFRDPTTAWYGPDGRWRLIVGSLRNTRGMAILYRSKDFVHWTKAKHPLHTSNSTGMWECPDFYPVSTKGKMGLDTSEHGKEQKYVLKSSLDLTRYEYYTIGSYLRDVDKYVPDGISDDGWAGLRYDYGNFYASKTFYDAGKKRRILWGWSNESDTVLDDKMKGWSGIQTIPRAIWLDSNQRQLMQWPVEELESIRGKQVSVLNKKLEGGSATEISGVLAAQADVEVTFQLSSLEKAEAFGLTWNDPQKLCEQKSAEEIGGVGPFGLLTLASSKREEQTAVYFRIFKAADSYVTLMCHDSSRSSKRPSLSPEFDLYKPTYGAWVDIDIQKNGNISLRSLIDHSVVESFGAGGKACITSRVYPVVAVGDDAHLFVFNYGEEEVKISELKAWDMKRPLMNGV